MKCQINAKLLYGGHVSSAQFSQMTPLGNHLVNVLMKLMKMGENEQVKQTSITTSIILVYTSVTHLLRTQHSGPCTEKIRFQ